MIRCKLSLSLIFVILLTAILVSGCATIGPQSVSRDRLDYVSAISESWKRQTLLNLLKIRYMDIPVFLDVASVINQYTLESEVHAGFSWEDVNKLSLGGNGLYADRPTITYNPIMGEKFARSFLMPLPIPSVMLLIQYGYPADQVLEICVHSINGLNNRRSVSADTQKADTEFYEFLDLFRQVYEAEAVDTRIRQINDKNKIVIFFRLPENETDKQNLVRIKELLSIDQNGNEFLFVHGRFPFSNNEIAVMNRSMMQIMSAVASQIDVPESDVAEGRVIGRKKMESSEEKQKISSRFTVNNGTTEPDDDFVSVRYRNRWFWIDDRDIASKRVFQFLLTLFSFTEKAEAGHNAPIITVPTN